MCLERLRTLRRRQHPSTEQEAQWIDSAAQDPVLQPGPESYPVFPPPPPEEILQRREEYWGIVSLRKYAAPQGEFEPSPLYELYRLYECFVLDKVISYRNLLEWFWRRHQWPICEIPDPRDQDPARYAFLACVTYLMVRSFNARVSIGLARDAPAIMSTEVIEEAKRRPHDEKLYESVPSWAEKVPALYETLSIPTEDSVTLDGKSDKRADPDFLAKNILLWTPHIHFT